MNWKQLLTVTDKLLGRRKTTLLPTTTPDDNLPDNFTNLFHNKITTIREKLDHIATSQIDLKFCHLLVHYISPIIFRFSKANLKDLYSKSCDLDPVPTTLLLEFTETLLPALMDGINPSLFSSIFPKLYKNAIVKPLLKRHHLIQII